MLDTHIPDDVVLKYEHKEAWYQYQTWVRQQFDERPWIGFTKTLSPEVQAITSFSSFKRHMERALKFHFQPEEFYIVYEGIPYQNLHAHGLVVADNQYELSRFQEVSLVVDSYYSGHSRTEWVRDKVLWLRYLTKTIASGIIADIHGGTLAWTG